MARTPAANEQQRISEIVSELEKQGDIVIQEVSSEQDVYDFTDVTVRFKLKQQEQPEASR